MIIRKKIRYAVVGMGHIAQSAVLPAFAHAQNSELVAIFSDDAEKRQKIAQMYGLKRAFDYGEYENYLTSGEIDAVYITLPNHLHCEYTLKAARAGVHVLCEKPMAITEEDCQLMIQTARENEVKLMIAYRLHFEEANLKTLELARSGRIGELRIFNSIFTMQVKEGDIRLKGKLGGGTLYDIGVYCINAARNIFSAEPEEVLACSISGSDKRFEEVDEATCAILKFPGDRVASFTASFGATDISSYRVVGTRGDISLEPAYEYKEDIFQTCASEGKKERRVFPKRDQFAPELIYFSQCIIEDKDPEPSGVEGLADVRVVEALYKSAEKERAVKLAPFEKRLRPDMRQEISRPPSAKPDLVKVQSPTVNS